MIPRWKQFFTAQNGEKLTVLKKILKLDEKVNSYDTKIDNAVSGIEYATEKADGAVLTANAANTIAETANATANSAKSLAEEAYDKAGSAEGIANAALTGSNQAQNTANNAFAQASAANSHFPMYEHNIRFLQLTNDLVSFCFISTNVDAFNNIDELCDYLLGVDNVNAVSVTGSMMSDSFTDDDNYEFEIKVYTHVDIGATKLTFVGRHFKYVRSGGSITTLEAEPYSQSINRSVIGVVDTVRQIY